MELSLDCADQKLYMEKWTKASNWTVIQPADHSDQIDVFIKIGFKITNL